MSFSPRSSIRLAPVLGLALVMNACGTDDDDEGVDAGMAPADSGSQMQMDAASPPADAGSHRDVGLPPADGGTPPALDAGMAPTDAGMAPTDAGMAPQDAGMAPQDGGMAPQDAGMAPTDAGMVPTDAGQSMPLMCEPDFDMADACGGNPEGSWVYTEACGRTPVSQGIESQCPAVTIHTEAINNPMGALDIAGGTLNTSFYGDVEITFTVPPQCVLGDCITTELALQAALTGSTTSCTTNGASCDCEVLANFFTSTSGTLNTNNGVATVDTQMGQRTFYFCVSGDELTYREFGTAQDEPVFLLNR